MVLTLVIFEAIKHHLTDMLSIILLFYYFDLFLRYIQNSLIQASYWHDPLQEGEYQRKNLFLAEINNEIINNTVSVFT